MHLETTCFLLLRWQILIQSWHSHVIPWFTLHCSLGRRASSHHSSEIRSHRREKRISVLRATSETNIKPWCCLLIIMSISSRCSMLNMHGLVWPLSYFPSFSSLSINHPDNKQLAGEGIYSRYNLGLSVKESQSRSMKQIYQTESQKQEKQKCESLIVCLLSETAFSILLHSFPSTQNMYDATHSVNSFLHLTPLFSLYLEYDATQGPWLPCMN